MTTRILIQGGLGGSFHIELFNRIFKIEENIKEMLNIGTDVFSFK